MSSIPDNIIRKNIIDALKRIDDEGVPSGAHSSTYDVAYNGKLYPPKLVISWANEYANGVELDRKSFEGGYHTPCFRLLANIGFTIIRKVLSDIDSNVPYFEQNDFDTLKRVAGSKRDKNDIEQNKDRNILKSAYEKTEYWMEKVEENIFPGGSTDIRKNPNNQAGNFHPYNWAKIYPSAHAKDIKKLAYTVGIDKDDGFVAKIDTVSESGENREKYEIYRDQESPSAVWFVIPIDEGVALGWEGLISRTIEFFKSIENHYKKLDSLIGYGIYEDSSAVNNEQENKAGESMMNNGLGIDIPLNQILYGPPGTGKTFNTINHALRILDPSFLDSNIANRKLVKERFDELVKQGSIWFVTFHQSFSYEDFVEGFRAQSIDGSIEYNVEPGVFKQACDSARRSKGLASIDDIVNDFIEELETSSIVLKTQTGKNFTVSYRGRTTFTCVPEASQVQRELPANIEHVKQVLKGKEPANIYCKSYVHGIAKHLRTKLTANSTLYVGQKFNKYEIISITDEIVSIRKPNGNVLPYPRQILDELRKAVADGVMAIDDLRDKTWQSKLDSNIEPYLVNGYENLVPKLIEYLVVNRSDQEVDRSNKPVVLIIDEINRGNISSIFGELITLIEESKREGCKEELSVYLPYSKEEFRVPNNLYLIGTMNTADRSLALMDTALRRRFEFIEMMPDSSELEGIVVKGINIESMLISMNRRIEALYDREHTLGHAFFISIKDVDSDDDRFASLSNIFSNKIIPLLEEYFFEDWEKIRLVLADNQSDEDIQFIKLKSDYSTQDLFGNIDDDVLIDENPKVYIRNSAALLNPDAYIKIYETK